MMMAERSPVAEVDGDKNYNNNNYYYYFYYYYFYYYYRK